MTASTPFSIAETTPQDSDVASAFPATERTYRDTVETWLLAISTVYGYSRVPVLTTSQRDSEANWAAGNMIYNTTLSRLQAVASIGPVVWGDALGASDNFPSGTRMLFQQTAAPTGWTKESGAAYNDVAIRGVTGTVGPTGGSTAFSSVMTSRTPTGTNATSTLSGTGSVIVPYNGWTGTTPAPAGAGILAISDSVVGPAPSGFRWTTTSQTVSVSLGSVTVAAQTWTGTAMDFAVKYADVIIAQKA